MIKEIEELMIHWGEQRRRHGLGAGIGSQMGSIMQWKGWAPRVAPGSRILAAGTGMDQAAGEIDMALAHISRSGGKGTKLYKLATSRYVLDVTRREQMREIGIAEDAERTYRNWVQRLHQEVLDRLNDRFEIRRRLQGK